MKLNPIFYIFILLLSLEAKGSGNGSPSLLQGGEDEMKPNESALVGEKKEEERRLTEYKMKHVWARGKDKDNEHLYLPGTMWRKLDKVYTKGQDKNWRYREEGEETYSFTPDTPPIGAFTREYPGGPRKPVEMHVFKDRFPFLPGKDILVDKGICSLGRGLRYELTTLEKEWRKSQPKVSSK